MGSSTRRRPPDISDRLNFKRGDGMRITRRYFLKSTGIAAAAFASQPLFLTRTVAASQSSSNKRRPVLIALFQRGAADGLSMVPPFGDPFYYKTRPQIAISPPTAGGKES